MSHEHLLDRHAWRMWTLALLIQVVVVVIEILAIERSDSRALISDMLHNSADVLLLMMTAVPFIMMTSQKPDHHRIKGFRRATLFINVIALTGSGATGILIGLETFNHHQPVHYEHAWPAAVASLIGNILIYGVVRPFRHDHGSKVFGWHQLWDVGAATTATIALWAGTRINVPQLDGIACITIGVAMCLHWPMAWLFERNGHHHHDH